MENTTAFLYLTDLISVIGSIFTTPFIFGLSILQIVILTVVSYTIINIFLGGQIHPRVNHKEAE